jgi:SAM-dependent methyltransferase
LAIKLLPILPRNSKYTGLDSSKTLINKARDNFNNTSYNIEFIHCDVNNFVRENGFDIAVCHVLLLHITNPLKILSNMIKCISNNGKIICFEPHWISSMANSYLHGLNQNEIIQLGILQKLYENDLKNTGKDGNIGIKIPEYLGQLGVKNIECRNSDKVVFLDSRNYNKALLISLQEDGIGIPPKEKENFIQGLINRGLSKEEAEKEYFSELKISESFTPNSSYIWAPSMKITFGKVEK